MRACAGQEKLYCHWLSQASWKGSLAVLQQTSPESSDIFRLLQIMFSVVGESGRYTPRIPDPLLCTALTVSYKQSIETLRHAALSQGLTAEDFTSLLQYASLFYANMGNECGDRSIVSC